MFFQFFHFFLPSACFGMFLVVACNFMMFFYGDFRISYCGFTALIVYDYFHIIFCANLSCNISVLLYYPTAAGFLSGWGSSVLIFAKY